MSFFHSEGHLRQMRIFAQNPNSILDTFSKEFEKGFLQILSHSHGTKRIFANRVYQEYIADKNHVHMNSTVWTTLTGFCKYLGKEGKCIVDETEKGWYIQYIERDPEVLSKLAKREERKAIELNEEEINKKMIENQIKAAFDRIQQQQGEEKGEDDERDEEEALNGEEGSDNEEENGNGEKKERKKKDIKPIQVKLSSFHAGHNNDKKRLASSAFGGDDDEEEDDGNEGKGKEDADEIDGKEGGITVGNRRHFGRKMGGAFEQLMEEQEKRKKMKTSVEEKKLLESAASFSSSSSPHRDEESTSKIKNGRDDDRNERLKSKTWLMKGILVKVMNKHYLDGKYYKMKGVITDVWKSSKHDFYELEVEFYDEEKGKKRYEKFRESDVETVVPKINESGMLLKGEDRGQKVKVIAIHIEKYCCDVEYKDSNKIRCNVDYEELSVLAL
jgi:DNA/RNA-binding protein KIN17